MNDNDFLKECEEKVSIEADYVLRNLERFADVLDIPYNTYTAYENQKREPKLEMLIKIADLLNVSLDDLVGRKEQSNVSLIKIRNKVMQEVNKQNRQWGDESELTPHQWLGLIQEEVGEIAQAVNETYLPNKTKTKLGGKENIQKEIYQTAALLIRFSKKIEGE
ncbi:helix-turn-helix domain-containing protein [Megamonas funiformis]|uniref:helix-turn-helix domain-containing protein n=1 Tax=Megamonas funiformis TaxID=437897 RepID=UPI002676168C|nr:helix-turn-helix domain-containing protein [Megamonas funiformis]